MRNTSTLLSHLSLRKVRLALQNGVHLVPTNFAFARTLVLVVAPTVSRAGISMFAFIVHSPPVVRLPPGHPLCPVQPYEHHLRCHPAPSSSPAFFKSFDGDIKPITYDVLGTKLRCVLASAGLDPSKYSTHSLRRGGASYAFKCGAPVELISLQGDWSSDAVLIYVAQPLERRLSVARLIASNIAFHPS